jgi:hypothetical protein
MLWLCHPASTGPLVLSVESDTDTVAHSHNASGVMVLVTLHWRGQHTETPPVPRSTSFAPGMSGTVQEAANVRVQFTLDGGLSRGYVRNVISLEGAPTGTLLPWWNAHRSPPTTPNNWGGPGPVDRSDHGQWEPVTLFSPPHGPAGAGSSFASSWAGRFDRIPVGESRNMIFHLFVRSAPAWLPVNASQRLASVTLTYDVSETVAAAAAFGSGGASESALASSDLGEEPEPLTRRPPPLQYDWHLLRTANIHVHRPANTGAGAAAARPPAVEQALALIQAAAVVARVCSSEGLEAPTDSASQSIAPSPEQSTDSSLSSSQSWQYINQSLSWPVVLPRRPSALNSNIPAASAASGVMVTLPPWPDAGPHAAPLAEPPPTGVAAPHRHMLVPGAALITSPGRRTGSLRPSRPSLPGLASATDTSGLSLNRSTQHDIDMGFVKDAYTRLFAATHHTSARADLNAIADQALAVLRELGQQLHARRPQHTRGSSWNPSDEPLPHRQAPSATMAAAAARVWAQMVAAHAQSNGRTMSWGDNMTMTRNESSTYSDLVPLAGAGAGARAVVLSPIPESPGATAFLSPAAAGPARGSMSPAGQVHEGGLGSQASPATPRRRETPHVEYGRRLDDSEDEIEPL